MIKLYECEKHATSENEALIRASDFTGFNKDDFKYEVIKKPKRVGLFKKEDGIFHCWYEYEGMDAHMELDIADARLYFDTKQKKILVLRFGFKSYEIDYSGLIGFETVISSSDRTFTISNNNKALKGAALFGLTGAVVGAANAETVTGTAKMSELIIRLKFKNKESFEILTCRIKYDSSSKLWRDIIDQSNEIDNYFKDLVEN